MAVTVISRSCHRLASGDICLRERRSRSELAFFGLRGVARPCVVLKSSTRLTPSGVAEAREPFRHEGLEPFEAEFGERSLGHRNVELHAA